MDTYVLVEREGPIATFTLNRPDRRNALSITLLEELQAALTQATNDPTCRVLILKGAGEDFSSGFDLSEGRDLDASLWHGELLVKIQLLLAEAAQISIAVIHGYALAGGGAIAAACDFTFASVTSKFGYPVLKVGIVPTPGMPFLRHELNDRDFRELVLGGELWDAARAESAGLVNKVLPTFEEALGESRRVADGILKGSPEAVRTTKAFANRLTREALRSELEEAVRLYRDVRCGPDASEGLSAFAEKRTPDWSKIE